MKVLDNLFGPILGVLNQALDSFVRLETADDEQTLVGSDGSLVTYLRIDGCRQIVGDQEYARILEQATVKLGARFDRPGHALQVFFMRNPDRIRQELSQMMRSNRSAARAIGLDLDDLFDERERHLSNFMAWEDMYFVLWSRPSALSKAEFERVRRERAATKWVIARDAQYPYAALSALRSRHAGYVSGITAALEELGVQCRVMEVHEALRAARAAIYPSRNHDGWRAMLPGDPLSARMPEGEADLSDILWPPLRRQMIVADAEQISSSAVRIDNLLWTGLDMTLAPMEPSPFPQLLNRMVETRVPFRVSFLIESGGIAGSAVRKFLASILAFTNEENKQIKNSIDALTVLSRDEPVVRVRCSFATWAPQDKPKILEERLSVLIQAVESWGYCQVSQMVGDPLECVFSSALGISCSSTAPAAVAPLFEVVKLLPWQRPSSPFHKGAILFRSPDGRVWPYQTGSTLTTTWFDLIFAQPGAGKSVLMNALSLGTCLTPGLARLPFIAIIDIGPSSSGLISLLKDALPLNRRHEAAHYRLHMRPEYSINPFDTQLGCRFPLPDERSYLVELLTLLCTAPGQAAPYDGIPQLAGLVVDEMFRWRDDTAANAEPHAYLQSVDPEVDEALRAHDIHLPADPYWWDVVDLLFERGLTHEATLAQRHANPVLTDSVTAARRPQIRALLEETRIGASTESVINAFERMIASAIREFPILASVTRFDISGARVCALDLGEVAPQGDDTADRQTAIMYMLARHALVRHWWLSEDSLKSMPQPYRSYHEARLRDIRETPKRLCYDEFHRTTKSKAVRAQVVRDVREGRKWGVQIVLSSQLLDDFDEDMVDLATGVWILGAAISDRATAKATERFGLSETAKSVMRNRLTGPRPQGAPALLILGTNEGRYEQHLINTLGPIELWALSTSAEDVAIRTQLYTRIGADRARRVLAAHYPGGSARSEIRRRVTLMTERGQVESAATSSVIDEIVAELVQASFLQKPQAAA